jgi:hypothetical protein
LFVEKRVDLKKFNQFSTILSSKESQKEQNAAQIEESLKARFKKLNLIEV